MALAGGDAHLPQEFSHWIGAPVKSTSPALPPRNATRARTVTLEPAAVQVVYVKSTGAYSPLLVSQFILKK